MEEPKQLREWATKPREERKKPPQTTKKKRNYTKVPKFWLKD
jgi:hypothetical protein